ncbi:SoxY-related AACIE arm protein [Noviherbaspirillum sp. 17J57-3]|uniref:SoxY-related AACIE arm protein n=2 Tax=Noviherbaspirillum galbum TaxID=2709383 RepID=A0A6B3SW08_9BURK|nr:SoxY-related AACIE arm protein [Noviherbaspirillum galbum]
MRRLVLAAGMSLLVRPASATPQTLDAAIRAFTGGAQLGAGKVVLDVAPLVDNGNVVPLSVRVDSPMSADNHVTDIAVFNERNPQSDVARFRLGPRAGKAEVSTRIRLATSQKLTAIARFSDGSFQAQTVDVIVTLAACIEGEA